MKSLLIIESAARHKLSLCIYNKQIFIRNQKSTFA